MFQSLFKVVYDSGFQSQGLVDHYFTGTWNTKDIEYVSENA